MASAQPFVFVSLSPVDARRAAPLLDALRADGVPLYRFEDLVRPADDWHVVQQEALRDAAAVLVIWSRTGSISDGVTHEADRAASAGKLVPVTLDGVSAVPTSFGRFQTVDLSGWSGSPEDEAYQQLSATLRARLAETPAKMSKAAPMSEVNVDLGLLDPAAVAVLARADGLRLDMRRDAVHMEHLIDGLYADAAGRSSFESKGVTDDVLRRLIATEVPATLPADVRPSDLWELPPLSRHATEALAHAARRAQGGEARVTVPSLLRGALEVQECRLIHALYEHGMRPEDIPDLPPSQPAAREHVGWVADEPVALDRDSLGRRGVAVALESQLRELVERYPGRSFLVHIDGSWGAGKSTLLRFLNDLVNNPPTPRPAVQGWRSVDYDAWRQSRVGPPWLTLLQAVRSAVRAGQGSRARRIWFSVRERARLVSTWQWLALALMVLVAAALALVVVGTVDGGITLTRWSDVLKLIGGVVPAAAAAWLIAGHTGRFLLLDSRRSARAFLESRADPMEDLATHFRWVLRQAGRPVLLLIDDLDRCPESFVVELLDAVQKLMREPHPVGSGSPERDQAPCLLVVVAADGRWIRQAYDNAYASLEQAVREPGATIGSLFLEKMFQLTMPVPRLPDELRRTYLARLLADDGAPQIRTSTSELAEEVRAAPRGDVLGLLAKAPPLERLQVAELAIERLVVEREARLETEHALEPFGPLLDPTPRAMKRFVMAYSVLRAVRTAEGSVVPVGPLALWTVMATRWPLLAVFLQQNPAAVRFFSVPPERLVAAVPPELKPMFSDPPDDLRAVMNHPAGPLDADTIRECCGQLIRA